MRARLPFTGLIPAEAHGIAHRLGDTHAAMEVACKPDRPQITIELTRERRPDGQHKNDSEGWH